jgi:hypothetical protein
MDNFLEEFKKLKEKVEALEKREVSSLILDSLNTNLIQLKEQTSSPSNPQSGSGFFYYKSNKKLYYKDSLGNERQVIDNTDLSNIYANDSDKVDGFHASSNPQANYLLALNNNAKFKTSAIGEGVKVVNRRIIHGFAGDSPVQYGNSWVTVKRLYGIFSYNALTVQQGATRYWRLYGIYSDDATTESAQTQIWFDMDWGDGWDKYFELPLTWGIINEGYRDAFSTTTQQFNPFGSHGYFKIRMKGANTGKLYFLAIEALDIFD